MLPEERIFFIVDQLKRKNAVTVKELANLCNVTTETIRNDLKKM
jgi:DeoR/GlpR family transcriptional regulator of sugar metabolism